MNQASLWLGQSNKRTRRRVFLEEMDRVVPRPELVALVTESMPEGRRGRPLFAVAVMLRINFMQHWFSLSDPAMEVALHDMALFRDFAGLSGWDERVPDESSILRLRRVLEKHKLAPKILHNIDDLLRNKGLMLRVGTLVDATLMAAPSSTKNLKGERDPEMKQSKKGNRWYFRMKAHIGVNAQSGPVQTVRGTAGSVNDVTQANALLHGEETQAFGDAGYQGTSKRKDAKPGVRWRIAMRPGNRQALDKDRGSNRLDDEPERLKASIRAKVEHPFRVIKRKFGHVKVRYRGLSKNTTQLYTLSALSNLWMVRRALT
ncbi:COG3039 Transposase and inactivated derivatives, IS5 family [Comamonadaceae bacterium]